MCPWPTPLQLASTGPIQASSFQYPPCVTQGLTLGLAEIKATTSRDSQPGRVTIHDCRNRRGLSPDARRALLFKNFCKASQAEGHPIPTIEEFPYSNMGFKLGQAQAPFSHWLPGPSLKLATESSEGTDTGKLWDRLTGREPHDRVSHGASQPGQLGYVPCSGDRPQSMPQCPWALCPATHSVSPREVRVRRALL